MQFYKNMKIKKKLLASFLAVALVSVIVGGVGTVGIITINNNENLLYNQGLLGSTAVSGLYTVIVEQRLEIRGMVINFDNEQAARENIAKLRARETEFDGLHNDYLSAMPDDDVTNMAVLKKVMDMYNGEFKTLKEHLITEFESGNEVEFLSVFLQIAPVSEEMTDMLYEMMVSNNQQAGEMNEQDSGRANTLIFISVVLTLVLTVLAVLLGLFNAKIIAHPLAQMADAARLLSKGDIEVGVSVDSKDEIGDLVDSFERMIDGIREQAVVLNALSSGDYTVSLPIRSDKDVMNQSIHELINSASHMIGEMQTASAQVTIGSQQVSQGAQGLASGSTEQAASIQQLSQSIGQVKDQVQENSKRSHEALANCGIAGNLMEQSVKSMESMLEAMASIAESSQSITRIIKVIDDIAFQTNILALNAAVEAARAGQHGKGFAVVADEVRNLASKSAQAAKETAALIESSTGRVKEGSEIVKRTNASLQEVDATAAANADIINEMTASLGIQANAIEGINQGIEQVAIVVQANAATAEESAAAAEEMSAQAAMLNQTAAKFKVKKNTDVFGNTALLYP